jgi:diguanylate cyclase (GGDEF)-like protein/PAS domain S-box-containing protein
MTVLAGLNATPPTRAIPPIWRLVGVAFLLGLLSFATIELNTASWAAGGISILWPTNGLLVGILLCQPKRQWAAYVVLGSIIDFWVNRSLNWSIEIASFFTLCNTAEVLMAAWLLYPWIAAKPDLTVRKQLIVFLSYGVFLAPAVTALLASFAQGGAFHGSNLHSFLIWFAADALGMAIVTPLCLAFAERKPFRGRSKWEVLGLLALLCAVMAGICAQRRFPFLFVLMPFLLLLGIRLGLAGSALGLLLVSILGGISLTSPGGPMASVTSTTLTEREVIFQIFVALSMLMVYIVEVVIAESQRLQAGLRGSERRFRLLAEASSDIISLTDLDGTRHYVSPASIEVLGYRPEEVVGGNFRDLTHPDDVEGFNQFLDEVRGGSPGRAIEYRCRKADGSYVWLETNPRLYHDSETGAPAGFVNVTRDISVRKSEEERQQLAFLTIEHLASSDPLTGIANRRHFDAVLDQEWNRAARKQSGLSLLLIDVDRFKPYNDVNGHVMGDECLRKVVAAIQSVLARPTDLLARYGGEEFVAVLPATDASGAKQMGEWIRRAVQDVALPHDGNPPHGVITVSIGCATLVPHPDVTHLHLLEAADRALYRAKAGGRNLVEFGETAAGTGSVLLTE